MLTLPGQVAGNEGRQFPTLADMVEHYRWSPITGGADFCVYPCPRAQGDGIYDIPNF